MTIQIDQIIRSNRKSIGLEISPDARLIVRSPYFTPRKFIERIVDQKKIWILYKQDQAREIAKHIPIKKFIQGEPFLYLGKTFPLYITDHSHSALMFNGKTFSLRKKNLAEAKAFFTQWYKKQALKIYRDRIARYEKMTGIISNQLALSNARKRWGSCNSKGNLIINWRLIMAPQDISDYVIVHELIHIEEKNHGKRFWSKVETILPQYKLYKKWLREKGHLLTL